MGTINRMTVAALCLGFAVSCATGCGKEKSPSESIPNDMPVYTGAKVKRTMELPDAGSLMAMLQTADQIDKVTAFYKEKCAAAGWTEAGNMADPAGKIMQLLSYTKGDRKLSVTIVNNQTENVTEITMVTAKLSGEQPESSGGVTAYFPAQRRRSSSTGNKTDSP